jgi:Cof subfamily protein (haloacid dehalogenase superfamily)
MTIRAICTDIDGTLLNKERQLSSVTIKAIRSLGDTFPVILASSRMPSAMRHLQAELGIEQHPLIAYNGGFVLRYFNGLPEILTSVDIPAGTVQHIISLSEGTSIHNSLYREDDWFAPAMDEWTAREERITKVKACVTELADVIGRWQATGTGAHKVMCMGIESEIHELERKLRSDLDHVIHIYRSRPTYLELAPKTISKATALELLINKLYDFPMENVMCCGDNYNDIEMIAAAGLGVAVDNAKQEVKAVATVITGRSIDDGVASAIKKYVLPMGN